MSRKPLLRNNVLPYHVTARANNREEFPLPPPIMWQILGSEAHSLGLLYGVQFHALVLMPNHFHMLITVPHEDLGIVMNLFMSQATRRTNEAAGKTGHLFGGPYYWSLINSSRYFGHALKYVYRNPVRGKLCATVEAYPFSTLHGLLGMSHLSMPIHTTSVGMEIALPSLNPPDLLPWLNTPFPKEAEELIQKGLRRKKFEKTVDEKSRRPYEMLETLI